MAWWGLRALIALVPGGLPRVDFVPIDIGVVLFTGAVAVVTAAMAGVAPALALARADLMADLRAGGRGVAGSSARYGRQLLVVVQVALAVAIVAAAGLLTRSLLRLQAVDLGLSAGRLVFVELAVPPGLAGSPRHARFLDEVVSRLQDVPGVAAATPVNAPPFTGISGWDVPVFTAEGQGVHEAAMNPALNLESIHPGYFDTVGVTLLRGRPFNAADREGTVSVAIVSADVAARTWPGQDPIGRRLKMGDPESADGWLTVVGIVAPTRYRELAAARPTLYLPARQFLDTAQTLVLRTALPVEQVTSAVRSGIAAVDPAVRVMRIAPFDVMLDRPLERPRFNALLSGMFAVAALLLAAVGVFAVIAALVRQREAEIGIRAALGATAGDLRRLVLGEGLRLAVLGAAAGLCVAAAGTRVMRGLLFEINPLDPWTLLAATLGLVAAAALASYLPARRAARVDPVDLLRSN
jgi:predicted permease